MRCPKCSGWVTPDLTTCPGCGSKLGERPAATSVGGSLLDRYRESLDADQDRLRQTTPDWGSPGPSSHASQLRAPSPGRPAGQPSQLERARAEELQIDVDVFDRLNFLLLNAGVSPVPRVAVKSTSRDGLDGLQLKIQSVPPVLHPWSTTLTCAGSETVIENAPVAPEPGSFYALDEAVSGQIEISLVYEDTVLVRQTLPVTVQSPNEWIASVEGAEQALAVLVTPNAPAVTNLLKDIKVDFVAYQSRDMKTLAIEMAKVYEAVGRSVSHYVGVPPSFERTKKFERTGQKVLFPDEVLSTGRGCCIDIAALSASLLERVGYNPLIVVVEGHAYTGIWTSDIQSNQTVIRDRELVKSAVDSGDLLVWNSTTYFDRDGDRGMARAIDVGIACLDKFLYLVDIAACRRAGIKPAPRRMA